MNPKEKRQRQKEINVLKYINPALEKIFQIILKSRIKINPEENITIKYSKESKDKLIDLPNYNNQKNPHNYEYNIYIFFCDKENEIVDFIIENWKFKISINPDLNEFNQEAKNKLLKKLHTLVRSIQSLQCLLPNYDMANQNFDYYFKAQIYKESNSDVVTKEEIKKEKKTINLEMNDDKLVKIQLIVNYITRKGILTHKDNLKKVPNSNEKHTEYFNKIYEQKTLNSLKMNERKSIENNEDKKKNEIIPNFSQLFDDDNELMISNIIQNSMIGKKEDLNEADIKQIKKKLKDKDIDLEQLYSSCFENIEDINCEKEEDEILDMPTIMTKENTLLNNVKNNFIFGGQNRLIDEIYEEMEGIEIQDLLRYPPKVNNETDLGNLIIDDYMHKQKSVEKNVKFEDLVDDYFNLKGILINKN